jgi:hypothetical protein
MQRDGVPRALIRRREVGRAPVLIADEKSALASEHDERPAPVEKARENVPALVVAVAPRPGDDAYAVGFSADAFGEVARVAGRAGVVDDRR